MWFLVKFFTAPFLVKKITVPLLTAAFFADYLDAFGPLGLLLKLGMTVVFFIVYLPLSLRIQRNSFAAPLLACCIILYGLSRFSTLPSSLYELTKLTFAIVLILGCINASKKTSLVPSAPVVLESGLRKALSLSLAINGGIVCVQVILGNSILSSLGVPSEFFNAPEKAGRYSGLILNLPLWSAMLFTRILLADRQIFPLDAWHISKFKKILLYVLLVLSGQKYVILCSILYLLLRASYIFRMVLVVMLFVCTPLLLASENPQIADRVNQVSQIIDQGVLMLITEVEADADYPQFGFIDLRLNSWLYAWANIQVYPFGRGVGTWGDFSASFNSTLTAPVTLSETQWAHLIVENGLGALILIFFFTTPFLFAHPYLRSNLKWLGFFIFIAGWFTMGSSDYLWFFITYTLLFNLRGLHRLCIQRHLAKLSAQAQ